MGARHARRPARAEAPMSRTPGDNRITRGRRALHPGSGLLVISPHLGDAVLSCGALLAAHHVLNPHAPAGRCPPRGPAGSAPAEPDASLPWMGLRPARMPGSGRRPDPSVRARKGSGFSLTPASATRQFRLLVLRTVREVLAAGLRLLRAGAAT